MIPKTESPQSDRNLVLALEKAVKRTQDLERKLKLATNKLATAKQHIRLAGKRHIELGDLNHELERVRAGLELSIPSLRVINEVFALTQSELRNPHEDELSRVNQELTASTQRLMSVIKELKVATDYVAKLTKAKLSLETANLQVTDANAELSALNLVLKEAHDLAVADTKLKAQFLANMSHEIRTPMSGVIGMCEMLFRTKLDDRQYQYANNIRDGANTLLRLVNDILDFSKIEAGKLELECVDFDPGRIVDSTCELLALSARVKQLSLMAHIETSVPEQVRGDPERLRQILVNLASNAIKFSDHGEIIVRAHLESIGDGRCSIRFSVTDEGIGISKEQQFQLFKPFVQGDGSISRRFGGTGLGLSISKSLVELMNGTIGVDSSPGAGSTFWFVTPLVFRSHAPAVTLYDELRDVKILIVNDECQASHILDSYVQSWGMHSGRAASAEDALKLLRQAYVDGDPFKVAIVDSGLSDRSALDLAAHIFNDPAVSNTKLILLTSFDELGLGRQAMAAGFQAYLAKPIRRSNLLDSIITVCGGGEWIMSRSAADIRLQTNSARQQRDELILIAEDHLINQQVAQLYLHELGFTSHIASNGNEALQALFQSEYALILMDCQMPELDGYATTRAIRKSEAVTGRHIPIIAMTAHAMQGDREECLAAGMDDYITKPVDPIELARTIKRWLPRKINPLEVCESIESGTTQTVIIEPVDLRALHSRYGEAAQKLLNQFALDGPGVLSKLQSGFKDDNRAEFVQTVHGFKSICGAIFAAKLQATCADLECAARDGNWGAAPVLLQGLGMELAEVQEYLKCKLTKTTV